MDFTWGRILAGSAGVMTIDFKELEEQVAEKAHLRSHPDAIFSGAHGSLFKR